MRAGRLPVDEQLSHFQRALRRNSTLVDVLALAATMDLPRQVYQAKTRRWRQQWPELTILPWPEKP